MLILKDRYDPFAVLAMVERWGGEGQDAEAGPPVVARAIQEPVAGIVEVDTPSGWTQPCALKY